jgi:hypothetical protein
MPTGLFKTPDQSAQVEYDGVSIPIPRSTYEKNGYSPPNFFRAAVALRLRLRCPFGTGAAWPRLAPALSTRLKLNEGRP